MRALPLAAVVVGAGLALGGINQAKADYSFDVTCSGSTCAQGASLGNLTISENAADGLATQVVYTLSLTAGGLWDSGAGSTFFGFVTIGAGGSITNVAVSGTNQSAGTFAAINGAAGINSDGLNTNPTTTWNVGAQCTNVGSTNCGTKLTLTVTGSDLGIGSVFLPKGSTTFQVFAGADITCNNGGTACPANGALTPGNTGVVGATQTQAVPGPILGAGLPGLIAACAGLLGLARRRRRQLA
jgi:hypothetical protein